MIWAKARSFLAVAGVAAFGILWGKTCRADTTSTWANPAVNGPWSDATKWDNGVPNAPGDVANVPSGTALSIQVTQPTTVGQLIISSGGQATFSGVGPLSFDRPGTDSPLLQLLPLPTKTLRSTISAPISIASGEQLKIDLAAQSTLTMSGAITATSGDITKVSAGTLILSGPNSAWSSRLLVSGGLAEATTAAALGTVTGDTTVSDGGILQLDQSTAEPINLQNGTIQLRNITLSGPISLTGSGQIYRPKNPVITSPSEVFETTLGTTVVAGNIAGDGDLVIDNESRDAVNLSGQNTYTGTTYIKAGQVIATTSSSLGAAAGRTIVQGGVLTVQAATSDAFRVEGGQLKFSAGNFVPADPIVLAGGDVFFPSIPSITTPVVLDGTGGGVNSTSLASWVGGSTGSGALRVSGVKVDAQLNQTGDLILNGAQLDVANNFTGNTFVTADSSINNAGAFAQSTQVRIQNGQLTLNVLPSGSLQFIVEKGTLVVPNSLSPFTLPITLGGTGDAALSGGATINSPIQLAVQTGAGHNRISGGTINGVISGQGNLQLDGGTTVLNLNAANNIHGLVEVTGGTVNANTITALSYNSTVVSNGRLNLNAPTPGQILSIHNLNSSTSGTITFNAAQNYADSWVVNAGAIEAAAPIGMSNLISIGGTVRGIGTGSFRIDGDLTNLGNTAIEGGISGSGDIHSVGYELRVAQNLANFTGDFYIQHGLLSIGILGSGFTAPTAFSAATDIHVYDNATISFVSTSPPGAYYLPSNIYLHNTQGYVGNPGALVGNAILAGRVDVGDEGSTISGAFQYNGSLTGRNVTFYAGSAEIPNTQNQLKGVVRLTHQSALGLQDQGRLLGIDSIRLEQGSTISLAASTLTDRIDDAAEIDSLGGFLSLYSSNNSQTTETVGTVNLQQGNTRIFVSSDHGSLAAGLTISNLERAPGATLHFSQAGFQNATKILAGVNLKYGIIGPWAVTDDGFATAGSNGMVTTIGSTQFADINAAGAQDHTRISGNQSLASDKSIASLQYDSNGSPATLDLNGHTLTVLSGGVFRSQEISDGRLTAGGSGDVNPELVFHDGYKVSADIVDNAAGGKVGLVLDQISMHLTGNNSYTGGTWVVGSEYYTSLNAAAIIDNLSAVPAHDRVYVDRGLYSLALSAATVSLDELHVRNGGTVGTGSSVLNVQQMFLESGSISGVITGAGSISKTTDGAIDFINLTGPNYTGTVSISDGVMTLANNSLPKAGFVVDGGQLTISSTSSFANNVTLKGGSLGPGHYTGTVDVQADSGLLGTTASTLLFGKLTGTGDLVINGSQQNVSTTYIGVFGDATQFSGNVRVESGALRVGSPGNIGSGIVTVEDGTRLTLGSSSYTNPATSINNEVQVNGGTLYSTPPADSSTGVSSPSIFAGNVYVHDHAYIGASSTAFNSNVRLPGLTFAGALTLTDGANVYGLSNDFGTIATGDAALVDISGQLNVGANTTWHLLTSTLSISGTIRPLGLDGSIDFEGIPSLLRMGGAAIQVNAGQSLSIKLNGQAAAVVLTGGGNNIQGNGLLAGNYTVADGAAVSPGNSPGLLTIDGDTTFGTAGHLSIELAGLLRGSSYDALDVSGDVVINGGLLDLSLLNGFVPSPSDAFVILRANHVSGKFSNAISSILVGGQSIPVTYFDKMIVLGNAAAVPEPLTTSLIALAFGMALLCRRRNSTLEV